jgi:NAD+ synthase (glutamine-hydrolysing)
MDFDGNLRRIKESITVAKQKGARYRLGPELEVCGYGCEDHFLEQDTVTHSWECIAELLKSDLTDNILCDVGMPVVHAGVRYNCRVLLLNRRVVLIRPKTALAIDGNYREERWFTAWRHRSHTETHVLPPSIRDLTGQESAPFGDASLALRDTTLAPEMCEELFVPASPHTILCLSGVEIVTNGSGSHHQLRKLHTRVELMVNAMAKNGGVYVYANQQCCDGGRLYFDGCAMIVVNGHVVAQGSQFSLQEVEVVTAVVDLDDVRRYRAGMQSRAVQSAQLIPALTTPRVSVDFVLSSLSLSDCAASTPSVIDTPLVARLSSLSLTPPRPVRYHTPEEEIAYGPACWLWDYLRRSNQSGFFLPLSGGADSSAVAAIVGIMCRLVYTACCEGNAQVLADTRRVTGLGEHYLPSSPEELCHRIFFTCYMGSKNSSLATQQRAEALSKQLGAHYIYITIDSVTEALENVFVKATQKRPKFKVHGGSDAENVALQNIQARSRMVLAYFFAQLLLWSHGRTGNLLVLGTANVDEALRGYLTKYDCSSADINPIGGISKLDLKRFLLYE